jgi:hypothetical protein
VGLIQAVRDLFERLGTTADHGDLSARLGETGGYGGTDTGAAAGDQGMGASIEAVRAV